MPQFLVCCLRLGYPKKAALAISRIRHLSPFPQVGNSHRLGHYCDKLIFSGDYSLNFAPRREAGVNAQRAHLGGER